MRFTDAQVSAMLTDYVEERMTLQQFARRFKLGNAAAKCLLKGLSYPHVPRPGGFAYPWHGTKGQPRRVVPWKGLSPKERHQRRYDLLCAYVAKRMGTAAFSRLAGVCRSTALLVLSGRAWRNVERPPGFAYPWPERADHYPHRKLTVQQVEAALELRQEYGWSTRLLAQHLGVGKSAANDIVKGRTYLEAGRP